MRLRWVGRGILFLVALAWVGPSPMRPASGDDLPIVIVSRETVTPPRLVVHVGEVIRWRSATGGRLRIQFDDHLGAHEVVIRSGEVLAVFRRPGEHWYTGSLLENEQRTFRGVVVVGDAGRPAVPPFICGPESSDRMCIAP